MNISGEKTLFIHVIKVYKHQTNINVLYNYFSPFYFLFLCFCFVLLFYFKIPRGVATSPPPSRDPLRINKY